MNSQLADRDSPTTHKIVSHQEWIESSKALLVKEKELTRLRDQLSQMRRDLPWERVEKNYVFEGPAGQETFSDLFDGRSQLIVYHFMGSSGPDDFCHGCSFVSDHTDAANLHLAHHDVTLLAVSRTAMPLIEQYKRRMGWKFQWYSSLDSDFSYDFGVSFKRANLDAGKVFYNFTDQKLSGEEQPGLSVFYKNEAGEIFHTYSSYERGLDLLIGAYNWLDLTPKGRNEESPMDWVNRHDEYETD